MAEVTKWTKREYVWDDRTSIIDILHENGHYAGYVNGKLYCTGDTYNEVERELEASGLTVEQ